MTFQEFIHMGGHGFYVWSSYGIALVIFVGLYLSTRLKNKKLVEQLQRRYRQEQREQ